MSCSRYRHSKAKLTIPWNALKAVFRQTLNKHNPYPNFQPRLGYNLDQFVTYKRMILLRGDHTGYERNQHLHNFKEQTRYILRRGIRFPFDRDQELAALKNGGPRRT